jgi:hypothetical protein
MGRSPPRPRSALVVPLEPVGACDPPPGPIVDGPVELVLCVGPVGLVLWVGPVALVLCVGPVALVVEWVGPGRTRRTCCVCVWVCVAWHCVRAVLSSCS